MRTCIVTLRPIPTIKGNCNVTVWLGYSSKPVVVRTFLTPIFKWFRQFRSGCYYLDCCIGTLGQGWKWLERFLRVFHTELGTVVTPGGTNCCHLQFRRRSRVWVLWDIGFLLTRDFRCGGLAGGWCLARAARKSSALSKFERTVIGLSLAFLARFWPSS